MKKMKDSLARFLKILAFYFELKFILPSHTVSLIRELKKVSIKTMFTSASVSN
jgi:hypothetical protein